jgi:hypothetical protein
MADYSLRSTLASILAFGASALSAPIMAGAGAPKLTDPLPVADLKAGVNAGGLVGADVDASIGGNNGAKVGAGAVGSAAPRGDAKVNAGAKANAGSAKADVDTHVGTGTRTSDSKIDVRADAGANGAAGGTANADADVDIGGIAGIDNKTSGGAKVDADIDAGARVGAAGANLDANVNAGSNPGAGDAKVGADVDASAEADRAKVDAGMGVAADGDTGLNTDASARVTPDPAIPEPSASAGGAPPNSTIGADATVAVPAIVHASTSILLPLLPLESDRADGTGATGIRDTQLAMLGCVDRLSNGDCRHQGWGALAIQHPLRDRERGGWSCGGLIWVTI